MLLNQTLIKSSARVAAFFRRDWKASSIIVILLLLLSFVSDHIIPVAPRAVTHARTPIWATLVSLAISTMHWAIVMALLLRAKAWAEGNRLSAADTIKGAYSVLGYAILTLIAIGLYYFAIPAILLTISAFIWRSWPTNNPNLYSIILFLIGACTGFGGIFSAPILIVEKDRGFRNVTRSLKLSVKELRVAVILIVPWCFGSIFQIAMNWIGWHTYLTSLLRMLIAIFTIVFSFFVYTVIANWGPRHVDEAA